MNSRGQAGLETHLNQVLDGLKDSGSAAAPPEHQVHLTFEPSYGVAPWWEAGAYLQFAYLPEAARREEGASDRPRWAGVKLRSKFMPERPQGQSYFYGLNLEVSDVPPEFEEHRWAAEVRPILGWEAGRFYLSVNPILGWALSAPGPGGAPTFEPCGKVRWDAGRGQGLGFEYYAGLGKVNHLPPLSGQEHYLYAAWDLLGKPLEANVGVGRGLTKASNDWTIKLIVGRGF
jgi:hypothetical protein